MTLVLRNLDLGCTALILKLPREVEIAEIQISARCFPPYTEYPAPSTSIADALVPERKTDLYERNHMSGVGKDQKSLYECGLLTAKI